MCKIQYTQWDQPYMRVFLSTATIQTVWSTADTKDFLKLYHLQLPSQEDTQACLRPISSAPVVFTSTQVALSFLGTFFLRRRKPQGIWLSPRKWNDENIRPPGLATKKSGIAKTRAFLKMTSGSEFFSFNIEIFIPWYPQEVIGCVSQFCWSIFLTIEVFP